MEYQCLKPDGSEATYQIMRTTCPRCHEGVEFALSDDDRLYREDAKYYEGRCNQLNNEVKRLTNVIDRILGTIK